MEIATRTDLFHRLGVDGANFIRIVSYTGFPGSKIRQQVGKAAEGM
jgi:hypothetical protein